MIEFKGYLDGKAEKHFWNKQRIFFACIVLFAVICFLPIALWINLSDTEGFVSNIVTKAYIIISVYALLIILFFPIIKKVRKSLTPKRIYIEDLAFVCVTDKEVYRFYTANVKYIVEYDEFYDVFFYLRKGSPNYVCQKSKLSSGSLKDFEDLFKGKIRKSRKEKK